MHIMIVDDDEAFTQMIALMLNMNGHTVSLQHTAEGALESALQVSPQAFLIDIGLPGMNGYEMARLLRESPSTEKSMLIAITGYASPKNRERSYAAGFDHHLFKPIDTAKLSTMLNELKLH